MRRPSVIAKGAHLWIERRLPSFWQGQRQVDAGAPKHEVQGRELLQPESGLAPGITRNVVRRQNNQNFHAPAPFVRHQRSAYSHARSAIRQATQRRGTCTLVSVTTSSPRGSRNVSVQSVTAQRGVRPLSLFSVIGTARSKPWHLARRSFYRFAAWSGRTDRSRRVGCRQAPAWRVSTDDRGPTSGRERRDTRFHEDPRRRWKSLSAIPRANRRATEHADYPQPSAGLKVAHETQYFADPFKASEWREKWIESMDSPKDQGGRRDARTIGPLSVHCREERGVD